MRAVICGAGIAGLTLAWWLERDGWEVVLVERAGAHRGAGYLIDFFAEGYDTAERMGLLPELARHSEDAAGVRYRDGRGRVTSRLDYATFRRLQRGRLLSLMRGGLENALAGAVGPGTEVRFATTVDAVSSTAERVDVTLSDGSVERADLLVGADGVHSRVRHLVFGAERTFLRHLGYHTAAYVISDADLARRLDRYLEMREEPGAQAGVYRMRDDRVAALFVHRAAGWERPADPRGELRRVYGGQGWLVPELLERCPADLYYDTVVQVEMPVWTHRRVALVGDACQAVSLLAGQGASMAMSGAETLAGELGRDRDVPAALERYERRVRPVVERKQRAGRRSAEWIVPATRGRLLARRWALRLATERRLSWLLRPVLAPRSR